MGGRFDLHVHTTASDGFLAPEAVVARARERGLICIAITDHDTAGGVARACAEGARLGLPVLAGAEFTAQFTGELHILGYGMDIASPAYLAFVDEQKRRRADRNLKMLEHLHELGLEMPDEHTPAAVPGEYGRKHMAMGLVSAGYAEDIGQAFEKYLAYGRPGYVQRQKFTAQELIAAINAAGGCAVLAHPGRMELDREGIRALTFQLKSLGLAGIEAFYPSHEAEEVAYYAGLAKETGLVCTYGSDWHGGDHPGLAQGFDSFDIPDETYAWLNGLMEQAGGNR